MIPDTFNKVIANLKSSNTALYFLESDKVVSLNYAELGSLIIGNVEHFQSLSIGRGERVIISLQTDVEHIITFLALVAIGAIPVSIKPTRTNTDVYVRDLANLCSKFGIQYGYHTLPLPPGIFPVAWRSDASSVNFAAIAEVEPEDLAFVQFSSGSTSSPKAVPISHANLMANLSAILAVDRRGPDSTGFNFLPLSHDMGLVGGLLSNLICQNSLLLTSTAQFLRRPVDTLVMVSNFHVNIMPIPDFAFRYLIKCLSVSRSERLHRGVFSSLRTIYCGAEPIRYKTITSFLNAAVPFGLDSHALFFCYGLAEGTLIVAGRRFNTIEDSFDMSLANRITARVGSPLGGAEVHICTKDLQGKYPVLEEGQVGAVQIRGPSVFKGYWEDVPRSKHDWFDTGDIGFNRNGELHICGRNKDIIIVNGENIFPIDIEDLVATLPNIRDSLVMVDEEQEEQFYVLAIASSNTIFDTKKISSFIVQHFGVSPKAVIQGLPGDIVRTTSGKPMRSETLRRLRHSGLVFS